MPTAFFERYIRKHLSFAALLFAVSVCVTPTIAQSAERSDGPCDIFAATTPCVAAISTTRSLYRDYDGPLYQITRDSDQTTHDVGLLADGYTNASEQDKFCAGAHCAITKLYDQSPNHNDLTPAPAGGNGTGAGPDGSDVPARAEALPLTIGGHPAYGIAVNPGTGYRNDSTQNIARHGEPEGVYMVTSALHLNGGCCFDFGNAETTNNDDKAGRMDAINIRYNHRPPAEVVVNLDLENGLFGRLKVPLDTIFVTAMGSNNGQNSYTLYQGDAQGVIKSGALSSSGPLPLREKYRPMRQEGAIILGIGGDNSNRAIGFFFEGVMTKGAPDSHAMEAVQANIVSAHYAGHLHP